MVSFKITWFKRFEHTHTEPWISSFWPTKPHGYCSSWMQSVIIWAVLSDEQIEQQGEGGASTKFCLQNFVSSSFNENTLLTHTWQKNVSRRPGWRQHLNKHGFFFPPANQFHVVFFPFLGHGFSQRTTVEFHGLTDDAKLRCLSWGRKRSGEKKRNALRGDIVTSGGVGLCYIEKSWWIWRLEIKN